MTTKIAKKNEPKNFFDPSQKIKPSDQKVPLYTIYEDFYQLKLICTHQAHQTPQKTRFYFNKIMFFEDFGVPGGCKSTLIGKSPHISYITELFGPRDLFFDWVEKIFWLRLFCDFWSDLKKNFNI